MFKNNWLNGGIVVVILITMYYSLSTEAPFTERIESAREAYKQSMLSMEDSPIDLDDFEAFTYFVPNEKFILSGDFKPAASQKTFSLMMTDSSRNDIPLAGTATLTIDNQRVDLKIFDEGETFLLPFTDKTNGGETYGGGRYINIDKKSVADGKIVIDFNQAHNFYCAYNYKYICPIPPPENNIEALIDAGEKTYEKL